MSRPTCRQCFVSPLVLSALVGCNAPSAPSESSPPMRVESRSATTSAATRPAAALTQTFDAAGIRFSYPAGWAAGPATGSTVLRAVAPPAGGGSATLTLDVPTLPAHIPGFLPIGLIAGGYVDDVKKRLPDATGTPVDLTVPDATARRVTLAGHDAAGHATTDDAVLMVHADRVYILAVDSDPAGRPAAAVALEAAVASIRWTR